MSKKIYAFLMYLWLGFIWFVSSLPAKSLPKLDLLKFDKLSHLFVYLVLSLLAFINQRNGLFGKLHQWDILFLFTSLAGLEEAHQYFIPNRQVSSLDLASNLLGIFLGYFIITKGFYRSKTNASQPVKDHAIILNKTGAGNDRAK